MNIIYPKICNVTQFFISGNCSTCFGWYIHPSSRAQTTVFTASGICQTVTASCRALDDGWRYHPKHVQIPDKIKCVTLHLFGYILGYDFSRLSIVTTYPYLYHSVIIYNVECCIIFINLITHKGYQPRSSRAELEYGYSCTSLSCYGIKSAWYKWHLNLYRRRADCFI
jgi:hypothetical protein